MRGREGGREGEREGGREGEREGGMEGGKNRERKDRHSIKIRERETATDESMF